jgi:monofunctional glycosyltransferase
MKTIAFMMRFPVRFFFSDEWKRLETALEATYAKQQASHFLVSPLLRMLLISGEDHRFFSHGGFDVIAIARAIWRTTIFGKREGASTIEQQIVRVLSGNYDRTIVRKAREILLSTLVRDIVPKKDLPALYLDIAYYGWKMNGLREASSRLGINIERPTLWEAASLVARLKYPQPSVMPTSRAIQIERRSRHLVNLYRKHSTQNVYRGLEHHAAIYHKPGSNQAQARLFEAS